VKGLIMERNKKGKEAEMLAARYLRARGYYIWKRNWRWGQRELDLVTQFRGQLVIVEVKSRDRNGVNHPAEVIDPTKQRNIILATEAFIRLYDCQQPTRFDVIAVIHTPGEILIEHIENAFLPVVE
jgi:putative endonuclease